RHRSPGIVHPNVFRRFPLTGPVAQQAAVRINTRPAVAGQIPFSRLPPWPGRKRLPIALAQVIQGNRRLRRHAVVLAFEEKVEPAQLQIVYWGASAVAQPTLPHLGNPGQMPPRAHQQPLRLSAFLEMPIGGEGAGEEAVVPAPHMQSRDIDTVEHGARRASPPIITAWWLVQPVAV